MYKSQFKKIDPYEWFYIYLYSALQTYSYPFPPSTFFVAALH